jgi:hypothetical protein
VAEPAVLRRGRDDLSGLRLVANCIDRHAAEFLTCSAIKGETWSPFALFVATVAITSKY